MTNTTRDRSSRRTTLLALGVSGVLHAAALLWLGLPIPALSAPEERLTLLPPLTPLVALEVRTTPPPVVSAAAPAAQGGGAPGEGDGGTRQPAPQALTSVASAPRSVAGEQLMLPASDSLIHAESVTQPAAQASPVAAMLPAESAGGVQDVQPPAPAAPAHIPGSAAKAKGGGSGASAGGSGAKGGFGGITIKVGGGPKKHPPRGLPGRTRW